MNKKMWFLTKNSLAKKFKSKWFWVVNIILLVVLVGVINIDTVISFFGGDFNKVQEIVLVDNTNEVSEIFKNSMAANKTLFGKEYDYKLKVSAKDEKKLQKEMKDKILIVIDENPNEYLTSRVISESKIDTVDYQMIISALNSTKSTYATLKSNVDPNLLGSISKPITVERKILDEDKASTDDNMEAVMSTVFPTVILPFFMLAIFLVQMIGAEIYEEKSSRSMEVIISNVSPNAHFASKILSANIFAITQGMLLLTYGAIGLVIRTLTSSGTSFITDEVTTILDMLTKTGFISNLIYIIPLTLILLLLSFIAYSLVAGILASLTVNMEDYQQIQTPIMLISILAYYLAIMSSMFKGAILIRVLSYVPFISCLLSPALLVTGDIGIIDVVISIVVLIIFNIVVFKQGSKIYKVGILNYSNEKIWTKLKKVVTTAK